MISLSPTQLSQHSPQPLLIDVRSALEYKTGHAPDAKNISLPRILLGLGWGWGWILPKWFHQIDKTQAIAVICLTAHRSPIAAHHLIQAGFTCIYNVTGGMREWQRVGLPMAR